MTKQRNITRKATCGHDAAIWVATNYIQPDPDYNCATREDAIRHLLYQLNSDDPYVSSGWWVTIGIAQDHLAGKTEYRPGEKPTNYRLSRQLIVELLTTDLD